MNLKTILKGYGIIVSFFTDDNRSENNPSETIKSCEFKTNAGSYSFTLVNTCVSEEAALDQALAIFIHDKIILR